MTDTIPYEITGKEGEIEFRKYPELVLATAGSDGNDSGFNLLFSYISGNNKTQKAISMTSPVITSQKIAMTSPVLSGENSMSFVMPSAMNPDETPVPVDSRVKIVTLPEREVAVIRFRGYARPKDVAAAELRLRDELKKAGSETIGEVFLMRYNPPWTPGFFRRNEVGIEIKK